MRRTPLRAGKPPQRKTWMRRVNRERKAQLYERAYGKHADYVRRHVCPVCGHHPVHAHHTKGRRMDSLVPLCWLHHRLAHDMGCDTFEREHQIDLRALARELWEISPARRRMDDVTAIVEVA